MPEQIPIIPGTNPVIIPEVVEEPTVTVLSAEDAAQVDEAVRYINCILAGKALETSILIGDYVLTHFFHDDMDTAFSKDPDKPVSFSMLCNHPDLCISRDKLINMVKVAAQERFFQSIAFNCGSLNYSHRLKLTRLPNGNVKIELATAAIAENLTVEKLASRVKALIMETAPADDNLPAPNPYEKAATDLLPVIDQLTRKASSLKIASKTENLASVSAETRSLLKNKLIALSDSLNDTQTECETLLKRIDLIDNPR
ncbi:MAG: hypothetical protein WA081_23705 [Desulfosalsimonadaceae bacterium]